MVFYTVEYVQGTWNNQWQLVESGTFTLNNQNYQYMYKSGLFSHHKVYMKDDLSMFLTTPFTFMLTMSQLMIDHWLIAAWITT